MTLFAGPIFDGTAHVNNIAAVGGTPRVATVKSSHFVATDLTVPANVALAVSMTPKPQGLVVGMKFSYWAEHGFPLRR